MRVRISRRPRACGLTLVEVMMALAVFAIAVVTALGAIMFSLKTVDAARTQAQVAQLLVNEMESLRMRTWSSRTVVDVRFNPPQYQSFLGIGNLCGTASYSGTPNMDSVVSRTSVAYAQLPVEVRRDIGHLVAGGAYPGGLPATMVMSPFYPFAVYGLRSEPLTNPPYPVARVGDEVLSTSKIQLRAGTDGYTCRRYCVSFYDPSTAGSAAMIVLYVTWKDSRGSHVKTYSTIMQSNGINNKIVRF